MEVEQEVPKPQSEIIMLMSQMRDAIAISAQCAQSSTSALEALRAERATETTLRGPDLAKVLSRPERFQASSRDEERWTISLAKSLLTFGETTTQWLRCQSSLQTQEVGANSCLQFLQDFFMKGEDQS